MDFDSSELTLNEKRLLVARLTKEIEKEQSVFRSVLPGFRSVFLVLVGFGVASKIYEWLGREDDGWMILAIVVMTTILWITLKACRTEITI